MKLLFNIIKKIFFFTLTGSFVKMCSDAKTYSKAYNDVSEILYSDDFIKLLYEYLGIDFKRDWIGRLYGVMNPMYNPLTKKMDLTKTIIELDGNNTNNNEHVKIFLLKQLSIAGDLFHMHGLYDYISMDIKHVGPISQDNWLVVFDLVAREQFAYSAKRVLRRVVFYGILALLLFMFIL